MQSFFDRKIHCELGHVFKYFCAGENTCQITCKISIRKQLTAMMSRIWRRIALNTVKTYEESRSHLWVARVHKDDDDFKNCKENKWRVSEYRVESRDDPVSELQLKKISWQEWKTWDISWQKYKRVFEHDYWQIRNRKERGVSFSRKSEIV